MGVERADGPSRVQGRALAAGGLCVRRRNETRAFRGFSESEKQLAQPERKKEIWLFCTLAGMGGAGGLLPSSRKRDATSLGQGGFLSFSPL